LFGLLPCLLWFLIMRRGFAYQIERRFLRDQTEALLKGDKLSRSRAATVVVASFAVLYLVIIAQISTAPRRTGRSGSARGSCRPDRLYTMR